MCSVWCGMVVQPSLIPVSATLISEAVPCVLLSVSTPATWPCILPPYWLTLHVQRAAVGPCRATTMHGRRGPLSHVVALAA